MAGSAIFRSLLNMRYSCARLQTLCLNGYLINPLGVRNLYSAKNLRIDKFLTYKSNMLQKLGNKRDDYMLAVQKYMETLEEGVDWVFPDDMRVAVHLAETEQEINLVLQMAKIFHYQEFAPTINTGLIHCGPLLMRLFHTLNKPEEAIKAFMHEYYEDIFATDASMVLLLDLLIEAKMYQSVIDICMQRKKAKSRKFLGSPEVNTLFAAAHYKLDTPGGVDDLYDLLEVNCEANRYIPGECLAFSMALCLNQGKPGKAEKLLKFCHPSNMNHITLVNVEGLTYLRQNKMSDAVDSIVKLTERISMPETRILKELIDTVVFETSHRGNHPDISLYRTARRCQARFSGARQVHPGPLDTLLTRPITRITAARHKNISRRRRETADLTRRYNSLPRDNRDNDNCVSDNGEEEGFVFRTEADVMEQRRNKKHRNISRAQYDRKVNLERAKVKIVIPDQW